MLDKSLRNFLFQTVWPDQTYNKNYKIKSQNLPKKLIVLQAQTRSIFFYFKVYQIII